MSEKEIKKRVNLLAEILSYEKSNPKVSVQPEEAEEGSRKLKERDIDKLFPVQLKSYYASAEL